MDTNHVEGPDPRNDLSHFAREILAAKMQASASLNGQLNPQRAKVESSFSAAPMTPARFEAPKGRTPGAKSTEESTVAVSLAGAFYSKYLDDDGNTWLQGGQVKSGSGNFTIADLMVIDAGTGIVADENDILVLEVTVTGYVVDGVLLAGLTATAAAYVTPYVGTVLDDTLPTVAASTERKVYIEIGRWSASDFHPSDVGNIRIAFCPGAYQITRY